MQVSYLQALSKRTLVLDIPGWSPYEKHLDRRGQNEIHLHNCSIRILIRPYKIFWIHPGQWDFNVIF